MHETIFYERSGRWAAQWRRLLADRAPSDDATAPAAGRLRESRSIAECRELLAVQPAGFLVLELERQQIDAVCQLVLELPWLAPQMAAGVVAAPELADHEWLLRELGTVHFITSPRKLNDMLAVSRRHLEQLPALELTLHDRIWQRLPWPRGIAADAQLRKAILSARRPAAEELIWEPIDDDVTD